MLTWLPALYQLSYLGRRQPGLQVGTLQLVFQELSSSGEAKAYTMHLIIRGTLTPPASKTERFISFPLLLSFKKHRAHPCLLFCLLSGLLSFS